MIHDVGYLGQGLVGSPVSIVMCDEIISYAKRFIKGFEINREKLAFDVISKVGPGGVFLAEMHTVKHFRGEIWRPKYLNRDDPESWIKKGKLSYGAGFNQQINRIKLHINYAYVNYDFLESPHRISMNLEF